MRETVMGRYRIEPLQRLMNKIEIAEGGCWEWQGKQAISLGRNVGIVSSDLSNLYIGGVDRGHGRNICDK